MSLFVLQHDKGCRKGQGLFRKFPHEERNDICEKRGMFQKPRLSNAVSQRVFLAAGHTPGVLAEDNRGVCKYASLTPCRSAVAGVASVGQRSLVPAG